jgi:hypothetical protein
MATKVKATKTINPLHFEDLEPHRFEDLVRRILYSFRDWSNIEATGRGGSDEGFDIRAWEKGDAVTNVSEEGEEGARALDGRLWQIQGKREKTITPAKMRTLVKEGVDQTSPPYGYILAAATNISKTAYDTFREALKKKGVTEFYFWGKDYLEDQLSLPQNDEILFTFFGLSLSPRRRSRITELKFNINNKNKILKLIFGRDELLGQEVPTGKGFLLRDVKAEQYPDRSKYPDFDKRRRWEEHDAARVTARGVLFKVRERYAYFDQVKKQWDYSTAVDLIPRKHNLDQANQARTEDEGKKLERFWRHLPQRSQAKVVVYGFVPFEDILIIDEKGDPDYTAPHVFIDFGPDGPFQYIVGFLGNDAIALNDDEIQKLKRVKMFPSRFPEPKQGAVYDLAQLGLGVEAMRDLEHLRGPKTIYSFDGKLRVLAEGSLIRIPKKDRESTEKYAEVTHLHETTVGAHVKGQESGFYRSQLERSAGRKLADTDTVTVFELHEVMLVRDGVIYVRHDYGY